MTSEILANDGVISLTAEAVPGFTRKIADDLAILGFPGTARQSLEDFFMVLHGDQSVSAVALVSATVRIPGPDLNIHVLWKDTADLAKDIRRIRHYHDSFSLAIREAASPGYYGTELHIEGPPLDSAHALRDKLVRRAGEGASAGVIAVATLIRS